MTQNAEFLERGPRRPVAVLCASRVSIYQEISGLSVYDARRDARTFSGNRAVIAHPPCRAWTHKMAHLAKPPAGESELGPFCVDVIRRNGGVLEQPAFSRLFRAVGVPHPNEPRAGLIWSAEVWQSWWGYGRAKKTWLMFAGIEPDEIEFPLTLKNYGTDSAVHQSQSTNNRAATTREFALWLIDVASRCRAPAANLA